MSRTVAPHYSLIFSELKINRNMLGSHVCIDHAYRRNTDFGDALPPKEMNPAEKHCKQADIVLCLGTRFT
ncbi:hypothetical protein RIF29_00147 [Crotalaria pallida]|uniref:Uncharacterized protein n=1 Tax=Crotalaria pallida TaxID=3830 RepID=A0AAN9P6W0_CROPI